MNSAILDRSDFNSLIEALSQSGYRVIGPSVRDGAIVYDEIASDSDLPIGWTEEQKPASYRLKKRNDGALFGYTVGPQSWKKFLHPAQIRLWSAERKNGTFQTVEPKDDPPKFAFLGVRACELNAILIQDKVFMSGSYVDSIYEKRRKPAFVIAVHCTEPGGTCFCASMNTGPKAELGYDLSLTEVLGEGTHYFVVSAGSPKGAEMLKRVPHKTANREQLKKADQLVSEAAKKMGRTMNTTGLKESLYKQTDHPRWEEAANRCLTCANCTMVCPTCFCTTVEDVSDVTGEHAERWRKWDSCFNLNFSYIFGGSLRRTVKGRYRQWMTHKLASWIDQFGVSGCVGCGRCITWCPVGIDITEEVRAIRGENR